MEEEKKEQGKKYAKLIAKVWSDEAFKERLLMDPRATLDAEGIQVPEGVEVKVVEQTDKIFYLVIPEKPQVAAITEETERIAAMPNWTYPCV
jgi:hypothetical protein